VPSLPEPGFLLPDRSRSSSTDYAVPWQPCEASRAWRDARLYRTISDRIYGEITTSEPRPFRPETQAQA